MFEREATLHHSLNSKAQMLGLNSAPAVQQLHMQQAALPNTLNSHLLGTVCR
jgi:hypothetical protein